MNRVSAIYCVTNTINNKKYIGQSINVYERLKQLKREWKYPKRTNPLFTDIQEYGIENFEFKVIEKCPVYLLNDKEQYYIEKYNTIQPNGYNRNKGGSGYAY